MKKLAQLGYKTKKEPKLQENAEEPCELEDDIVADEHLENNGSLSTLIPPPSSALTLNLLGGMKYLGGCDPNTINTAMQSPIHKKAVAKLNYTSENEDEDDIVELSKTQQVRRIPQESAILLLEKNKMVMNTADIKVKVKEE